MVVVVVALLGRRGGWRGPGRIVPTPRVAQLRRHVDRSPRRPSTDHHRDRAQGHVARPAREGERHGGGADERRDRAGAAGADVHRHRAGGEDQPVPVRRAAAADPRTARRPGRSRADPAEDLGARATARCGRAGRPGAGPARIDVGRGPRPGARRPLRGSRSGDRRRRARAGARVRLPGSALPGRQRRAGPPGAAPAPGASPPWRRPPDRDRTAASCGRIASSRSAWRAPAMDGTLSSDSTRMRGYVLSTDSPPRSWSASGWRSRTRSAASRSKPRGRPTPPSCSGSRTGWR